MVNQTELLGNIRGNTGPQGPRGFDGLPGLNAVENDEAFAAYMAAANSETFASTELSMRSFRKNIFAGYEMSNRWRPVVDRVLTGAGPAKVLCIGDSTTAGTGSSGTYANQNSYPSYMARDMQQNLALTTYGLSIPPSDNQPASDPRWTLGVGWAQATESGVGLGGRRSTYKGVPGGAGVLSFLDPRISADRYDIYYTTNQSSGAAGTFTAQSGAGTPVVVSTHTPVANGIAKVTVSGPRSSSTGVTIQNTGATGNVFIIGIEPYAAGESRIRVGNAGAAATTTSTWLTTNSGSNAWNVLGFLPVYDPDLTIIDLGINDAGEGASAAGIAGRIQTIADAAYATGSAVLIKTMIPSDGSRAAIEATYAAALKGLSPRYALLDIFNHYGTWARTNARGWMADWGHGNDLMYADEGALVSEMLFRYSGHNG